MTANRPLALCPHVFVLDAGAAVEFYGRVFGATELFRTALPDGKVLFVELAVGPGRLLLSEETPGLSALAPASVGGTPVMLNLEVEDPDPVVAAAVAAGAEVVVEVQEMFWGERYGVVRDPFGHLWAVGTAREELAPDEFVRRAPPDV